MSDRPVPVSPSSMEFDHLAVQTRASCGICGQMLDGKTTVCEACDTPYHETCWDYNAGCAVYGCRASAAPRKSAARELLATARHMQPFLVYPVAGLMVLLGSYALLLVRSESREMTVGSPVPVVYGAGGEAAAARRISPELEISVEGLQEALGSGSLADRVRAANALGALGSRAGAAVPALTAALASGPSQLRPHAARALGDVGVAASSSVATLVRALDEGDKSLRWKAAWALGRMGAASLASLPRLMQGLTDPEALVRYQCAWSLERILPHFEPGNHRVDTVSIESRILDALQALGDDNTMVRTSAAEVLGKFGGSAVVPGLVSSLEDPHSTVRTHAVQALERIGPAARLALPALEALLADEDEEVRSAAGVAIESLRG